MLSFGNRRQLKQDAVNFRHTLLHSTAAFGIWFPEEKDNLQTRSHWFKLLHCHAIKKNSSYVFFFILENDDVTPNPRIAYPQVTQTLACIPDGRSETQATQTHARVANIVQRLCLRVFGRSLLKLIWESKCVKGNF